MKIFKIEQGTDEWLEIRKGKLTASNAQAIASNGKGLETYVYSLLAEKYSTNEEEGYTNPDMERGNELEKEARMAYSVLADNEVEEVGFIEMDEFVGCSPDGLINKKGMLEIKCPNNTNYFKLLINKKIESKYLWQIQMQLLVAGREWCDFVAYNPNFEKTLIVKKIKKDLAMQEKLVKGIKEGKKLIKSIKQKYDKNNKKV